MFIAIIPCQLEKHSSTIDTLRAQRVSFAKRKLKYSNDIKVLRDLYQIGREQQPYILRWCRIPALEAAGALYSQKERTARTIFYPEEDKKIKTMDDYMREMMDLKTLVTRTLEKKGVLARIRAELRASVFEAIEDEDRALESEDGGSPALLGSCNDRAKQLHASPSGKLLTALICEYLEWAQLGHTLKVYLPECNLPRGFWKSELKEKFGPKFEADSNKDAENGPLLMEILETYLKSENTSGNLSKGNARRSAAEGASTSGPDDSFTNVERHLRRPQTSLAGGLPPLGRLAPISQSSTGSLRNSGVGSASDRMNDGNSSDLFDLGGNRKGSSIIPFAGTSRENGSFPAMRKEDHGWRYSDDEHSEDVIRASNALENIQLDRKARSLTNSWRNIEDGVIEEDSHSERDNF